ncbi:MAG: ATP-binding protein, partial [Chloroflexota bacterium]
IQPIQRLTFTAERISAGELNVAIGDVGVEDEIGILARALRRMRSNLINSYAELEKTAESLEQRVDELTEAYRALRNTQLELESANRRIVEADDSARFSLTTYIHDEILGLVDQLGELSADLDSPDLSQLTDEMDRGIRRLRYDLSVPILRSMGVELRRLVRETLPEIYPEAQEIQLSLDLTPLDRLPQLRPASAVLIYRFVQGAVSNAFRHAEASHIHIQADRRDGELCLSVSDDGRGFDPGLVEDFVHQGHYFFHDVEIRAKQLEGSFSIDSQPGKGARLEIVVPVE